MTRLKLGGIQRNDILIFNQPTDSIHPAIELKDMNAKRCIAIAQDTVAIKEWRNLCESSKKQKKGKGLTTYHIKAKHQIHPEFFKKLKLPILKPKKDKGIYQYKIAIPKKQLADFRKA